ncbi:MAG: hypothetical protein GVY19_05330 [Bacteroidetes bacterium]|jgi:protein SCO1/2|nr:hypothetical protein [Bacteroidota bacterium]
MNKYFFGFLLVCLCTAPLFARDYGIVEKQGVYLPGDVYVFRQEGEKFPLKSYIDKPTLITFSYFHCPGLCPDLHEGIAEIIQKTDSVIGIDYQIISISIDTTDLIEYGMEMKDSLIKKYDIPEAGEEWQVFLIDQRSLMALTESVGYSFRTDQNDIIHPVVSIMVSPEGMVSQYFYGTWFLPWHFQQAIQIAGNEETAASRIKTVKYCYNFEPEENTIVRQIAVFSGISMLLMVILFYVYLMATRRKKEI